MHLFDNVQRHYQVDPKTVFVASGEYSDFQEICIELDKLNRTERINNEKRTYQPRDIANYISSLCYGKRNKADPYYIEGLVAGIDKKGQSYLGYVDLYGTFLELDYITTGFSRHLCGHIINTQWNKDCDFDTAVKVLEQCWKALFVKNCPARDVMTVVRVTNDGITQDAKK